MTLALATRASQLSALTGRTGNASARTSQAIMLAALAPPATRRSEVSQSALLACRSAEGNVVTRTTQLVELVAYKTGIPTPKRGLAWTFTLDQHTFYVLDLAEEGTFVYDQSTNQWANFSTQGYEPQWNFHNGTMWGDRIVAADLLTTDIWEMDPSAVLDEAWRDIAHVVTGGISTRSRTYVACDNVRVSASIGQLDEVNGSQMLLRYSDDQEATWSPYYAVDLIVDDFNGEVAYRSLGSFMAPGRIFELSDSGGLIRIDGVDAFLNGFDNDQQDAGKS